MSRRVRDVVIPRSASNLQVVPQASPVAASSRPKTGGVQESLDDFQQAKLQLLTAMHTYLPEFVAAPIRAWIDLEYNLEIIIDRMISLFDSFRYTPPDGFMDAIRRVAKAARPVEEVEAEVDVVGGVVSHPPKPNEITPQPSYVNPRRFKKYDSFTGGGLY